MSRVVAIGGQQWARSRLQKRLQLECDQIPCPECGSYQPDMVPLLQRRYQSGMRVLGMILIVVGTLACAMAFGMGFRAWPVLAALPPAGLALICLRIGLARGFNPNHPSGSKARKAAGKQAEVFVPTKSLHGIDFIVGRDGTVEDVRYMEIHDGLSS
jgi:hypothetical protein